MRGHSRVQDLFVILLIGALGVSVVSLVMMGRRQQRRARAMSRCASELGMKFSAEDPFDVPMLYGRFVLMSGGHSPRAENVTYGRMDGRPVRAFDFRYEVGHGTQRSTRHYNAVVVECDMPLPALLMWHENDVVAAPLDVQRDHWRLKRWLCQGDRRLAGALRPVVGELPGDGGGQVDGTSVMLWTAVPSGRKGYASRFADVATVSAGILRVMDGDFRQGHPA